MIVTKHASYKFDRLSHPSSDPGPTQYQNQREEVLVEHQRSVVDVKSKPRMSHVTYIRVKYELGQPSHCQSGGLTMPRSTFTYWVCFFFQAEDGIRDRSPSRGLGDVYKRQLLDH